MKRTSAPRKKPMVTLTRTVLFMVIGLVGSIAFDASSVLVEPAMPAARPIATSPIASVSNRGSMSPTNVPGVPNVPIGNLKGDDEYSIKQGVERMIVTTAEIHTVVDGMPGTGLPKTKAATKVQVRYAHPYEETLDRLSQVKQQITEITEIFRAMPTPERPESKLTIDQAATTPQITTTAPTAPTIPTIPMVTPPPETKPVQLTKLKKSGLSSIDTSRLIALICGVLIAFALVRYVPRLFQNGKFERTQPGKSAPAAMEAPPLRDPALELADIMSSMGLTDGAAHALVERIRANPRQALSHWLKLLDVYRQAGKKEEFENAAEELRTTFNVKPGNWNPKTEDRDTSVSLENYPHIATQLKKLWPKPECSDFLLGLLADNREGKRAGFPLRVVEEIVLLLAMLRDQEQPEASMAA